MENPAQHSARALAELHGLSIKRVEAILRLKGLEEHWKKVCIRVRSSAISCSRTIRMNLNRLVFKTSPMVKKTYMHGFLILSLLPTSRLHDLLLILYLQVFHWRIEALNDTDRLFWRFCRFSRR